MFKRFWALFVFVNAVLKMGLVAALAKGCKARPSGAVFQVLVVAVLVALVFGLSLTTAAAQENQPPPSSLAARLKAVEDLVRLEALELPDDKKAADQAVKAYLKAVDPYSTYLSADDRNFLKDNERQNYSGVGMDVIGNPDGEIFCLPYEGGPADRAGVKYGDRLSAIEGESVAGLSTEALSFLIRGPSGGLVNLALTGPSGERQVAITREPITRPTVSATALDNWLKIKIYRFEPGMADEVNGILRRYPEHDQIILDLRGNIGGDLQAAIETAGLFLPDHATVVTVAGRLHEPKVHLASGKEKFLEQKLVLWQDHLTASASEVLIAALTQNHRAQNLGVRTFGKGVSQKVFPAKDGGMFYLTTGELIPPSGHSFNLKGLEPNLLVRNVGHEESYQARTKEAFAAKP